MDLAALRVRDTIKNIGELSDIAERYEKVTGVAIDHDVVEYHTVLYNAISVLSTGPPLAAPLSGTDWLSYLAWYVNGARWAFETIAEIRGYRARPGRPSRAVPQPPRAGVPAPRRRSARRDVTGGRRRLPAGRAGPGGEPPQAGRRDRTGVGRSRSRRPPPGARAPARPRRRRCRAARPRRARDRSARRSSSACSTRAAQRMHLAMASPTSLMLRHPRLRSLRADRPTERDLNDRWPAGAIPGTA